ncbi:hypothetical protein BJ322DRAFT_1050837 [Thelephora terrestris]|uniref:Secreted protein n=1 Tax=Thelephora terrestris TaxID=56493 RepID=A0A9P6L974_9AGAM|nr:hypothetical protein BJ322DRAFT_1050837 [Thelephora terrestris]
MPGYPTHVKFLHVLFILVLHRMLPHFPKITSEKFFNLAARSLPTSGCIAPLVLTPQERCRHRASGTHKCGYDLIHPT